MRGQGKADMRGQQVVVDHSGIAMTRATSITVGAASVYGVGLASPDPASHAMFTTFSLACIAGYYTVSARAAPALPPLRARRLCPRVCAWVLRCGARGGYGAVRWRLDVMFGPHTCAGVGRGACSPLPPHVGHECYLWHDRGRRHDHLRW